MRDPGNEVGCSSHKLDSYETTAFSDINSSRYSRLKLLILLDRNISDTTGKSASLLVFWPSFRMKYCTEKSNTRLKNTLSSSVDR